MKKILGLLIFSLAIPLSYAESSRTTTTTRYEETSSVPSDFEEREAQEAYDENLENEAIEEDEYYNEERMEEDDSSFIQDEDYIDYSDRTRTNRERKALNTGSDASDDK
jgi:hypothetical protein